MAAAASGAALLCAHPARSEQASPGEAHVGVRVLLDHEALAPGALATVGVLFEIAPGWHTYWRNSGDTGMPIRVRFDAPEGVTIGDVLWPAPARYSATPESVDYVYERQVMLLAPVWVDSSVPAGGQVTIRASVDYLVCKETCLPGSAARSVTASVSETPALSASAAPLFAAARQRLPLPHDPGACTARWEGTTLVIEAPGAQRVEYFPHHPEEPAPTDPLRDGAADGPTLRFRYPERVVDAERVAGVVSITRGRTTRAYELAAPTPRAR